MKLKLPIIIFFFFLTGNFILNAQQWLQSGQKWTYYTYGGWNPSLYGIFDLRVDEETIVEGVACKSLQMQNTVYYAYAENDAIYT